MKIISKSCIFIVTLFCAEYSIGQTKEAIEIGKPFPNYTLNDLSNFSKRSATISDFKGKALILDFWATWCAPCVAMLPRLQNFEKQFSENLRVITISKESRAKVDSFLNKMRKSGTDISVIGAIDDGVLSKDLGVMFLPHYVLIDKFGVLRGITGISDMTIETVRALVEGRKINVGVKTDSSFMGRDNRNEILKDFMKAYSRSEGVNPPGLEALKSSSILTSFIRGRTTSYNISFGNSCFENRKIDVFNNSALGLYRIAYGGISYDGSFPINQIVYDIQDTVKYKQKVNVLTDTPYLYCYSLIIPVPDRGELFSYMKEDLRRWFGLTCTVKPERRHVWALQTLGSHSLASKGGAHMEKGDAYSVRINNGSIKSLLDAIKKWHGGQYSPVFIDETGIRENIDLAINVNLTDISSLNSVLRNYGLRLVDVEREVEILTISDRQNKKDIAAIKR